MPCGARFLALYGNNDERLYDKSDLIEKMITKLSKPDMSGIKISSNRVHLGLGGIHLNLEEDEGLRRRPSGMEVTKHQG